MGRPGSAFSGNAIRIVFWIELIRCSPRSRIAGFTRFGSSRLCWHFGKNATFGVKVSTKCQTPTT